MSEATATKTRIRKTKEITAASVIADITKIRKRADAAEAELIAQLPDEDRARVAAFFSVGG